MRIVRPHYIIWRPGLVGYFQGSRVIKVPCGVFMLVELKAGGGV